MDENSKKPWKLLALALVIILAGSLLANAINTAGGSVTVKDVRWADSEGTMMSAFLYVPDGVTVDNPAPAMLVIGGGDTNREAFANWSLEFARRGYVVFDVDKYVEGYSEGLPFDMSRSFGGPEAFRYLLSLDIIDHDNIGMMGHSMGGMAIAGVASAYPDSYKAMVNVGSTPNPDARNTAMILGVDDGDDEATLGPIFDPIDVNTLEIGKVYGSLEDGTAKVLYSVPYPHATEIVTPKTLAYGLNWIQDAIPAPNPIPGSSQIWLFFHFGSVIAMVGFVMLFLALGSILLKTPFFKSLVKPVPEFKGNTGLAWWIGAVLTVLIMVGTLFYFHYLFQHYIIPSSKLWPMDRPNGIMGWAVATGVISIIVILINHFVIKGDRNATAYNFGLTSQDGKVEWLEIGKSLLLAFAMFGIAYYVLVLVYRWLLVNFGVFEVAFRLLTPARFVVVLQYLIPWMFAYIALGMNLHGLMRPKDGKAKLGQEILINVLLLAPWFYVWFPIYFGRLYNGGAAMSFAGGGMIMMKDWLWSFPPTLTIVAVISTYFYHKTGRVYVGAFLNAILVVWTMVAGNMFGGLPF
ncbi:alpha/beta fold hydrolase [bacterium]|nr:alpha/beta fold hydrolase [bacterium]